MQLADDARCHTIGLRHLWNRRRVEMRVEIMRHVRVAELSVGVVLQSREDYRPAGAARWRSAESIAEAHTLAREPVHVRSLDD